MQTVIFVSDSDRLSADIEAEQFLNTGQFDFTIRCASSIEECISAASFSRPALIIVSASFVYKQNIERLKNYRVILRESSAADASKIAGFKLPTIGITRTGKNIMEKTEEILNGTYDFRAKHTPTNNAMDLVPGLFNYLKDAGYLVTEQVMEDFILLAGQSADAMDASAAESLLRPILVKNTKEDQTLHQDVQDYFTHPRPAEDPEYSKKKQRHSNAQKELEKAKQQKQEAYEKYLNTGEDDLPSYITEQEYQKKTKDKLAKDYQSLVKKNAKSSRDFLLELPERAAGKKDFSEKEAKDAIDELKNLMKKAIFHSQPKKMMDFIRDNIKIAEKMTHKLPSERDHLFQQYKDMDRLEKEKERAVNDAYKSMVSYQSKMLEKQKSQKHRPEFTEGRNAVHAFDKGEPAWMDKEFKKLTPQEKELIRAYIRENAKEFRTRMSGYIRVHSKREIDFSETCKQACQTGGIPIRLSYVKPAYRKTKLLLMLDISGSCKEASELMLTFMYYMKECFSGGCLTYVFIGSIYDVTKIMEDAQSPQEAVQTILELVPRAGVYSDYYSTLKQFHATQMPKISASHTYAFFIGDARNNKNPTGEEYLKAISRKSRKTCWLNTDKLEKWGQGDSIIQVYEPYMDKTVMVRTPSDLFGLLRTLKR